MLPSAISLLYSTAIIMVVNISVGEAAVGDSVVLDVVGEPAPKIGWTDSYFADGKCWCWPRQTFAEGLADMVVPTIDGQWWTLPDVCKALGQGPRVIIGTTPVYNDIQCGRGPPAITRDEQTCPGRVDLGTEGCGHIGPYWDFSQADLTGITNRVLPRPADTHPDVVVVIDIIGMPNPRIGWGDSYSVGDQCFCSSTFDHGMDIVWVDTPMGYMLAKEACDMLGPGPGIIEGATPVYNDIQCGNGPPNNAGDEQKCPGRVDIGSAGCGHIGPKWNFDKIGEPATAPPSPAPTPESTVSVDMILWTLLPNPHHGVLDSEGEFVIIKNPTSFPISFDADIRYQVCRLRNTRGIANCKTLTGFVEPGGTYVLCRDPFFYDRCNIGVQFGMRNKPETDTLMLMKENIDLGVMEVIDQTQYLDARSVGGFFHAGKCWTRATEEPVSTWTFQPCPDLNDDIVCF